MAHAQQRAVFEVGCGVGNFLFPLLEEDSDTYFYACDFSPRAVDFVKVDILLVWIWYSLIIKMTSTTPSCSGQLPTHRIQRHLVPGAVYSSSLHLCLLKNVISMYLQPSTIFKFKSNNCKCTHIRIEKRKLIFVEWSMFIDLLLLISAAWRKTLDFMTDR